MTRTRQWYYDGALLGGETGKTVVVGAGQLDPNLWECRTQVDYGSASVAALLGPIPILSALSISAQQGDGDVPLTYSLNVNKIVHFVLSTSATKPTYAELSAGQESGGGAAPEAFSKYLVATVSSQVDADITSTSLNASYYIHAVIDGGADGDVVTATGSPVFIDTTALGITTLNPADNAIDVAIDTNLVLDMNDDVAAVGTIDLYDVTGTAIIETFTLSAGTGDNGGTVALSANTATTDRITINPGANLANSNDYAIHTNGLTDTNGNALPNITDNTTYNFTTVASGGAWVPSDHADYSTTVAAWYDASDASTISETGGIVSEFRDKTANVRHLAPTAGGNEPLLVTAGMNSLDVLRFDGVGDHLKNFDMGTAIDSHFFICIIKAKNASQGVGAVYSLNSSGTPYTALTIQGFGTLTLGAHFGNGNVNANQTLVDDTDYLLSISKPGGTTINQTVIDVDATATSPSFTNGANSSAIPAGTRRLSLGNRDSAGAAIEMDFAEGLLINGQPSIDFMERPEGYLAHKWGTEASLPGGHPYSGSPP